MTRELLTVREASQQLRMAEVTVRLWIATRKIASVKLGRSLRIPAREIERLVDAGLRPRLERRG